MSFRGKSLACERSAVAVHPAWHCSGSPCEAEELKSKSEPSIRLVKAALKDKEADAAAAAAGEAPKAEL